MVKDYIGLIKVVTQNLHILSNYLKLQMVFMRVLIYLELIILLQLQLVQTLQDLQEMFMLLLVLDQDQHYHFKEQDYIGLI